MDTTGPGHASDYGAATGDHAADRHSYLPTVGGVALGGAPTTIAPGAVKRKRGQRGSDTTAKGNRQKRACMRCLLNGHDREEAEECKGRAPRGVCENGYVCETPLDTTCELGNEVQEDTLIDEYLGKYNNLSTVLGGFVFFSFIKRGKVQKPYVEYKQNALEDLIKHSQKSIVKEVENYKYS